MKKYIGHWLKLFTIIALLNIGVLAQRSLTEGWWNLTELNGRRIENSKASIAFYPTKITGNGGCNKMFGTFATKGTSIKFSGIGTTRMFCGLPGVMKTETDFTSELGKATRYSVAGDRLRIYSGRRLVMKFDREYPTLTSINRDNPDLEDLKWVLDGQTAGKSTASPEGAFIVFDEEKGSAGGNTSCNAFGGTYVAQGEKIAITEIISTMRACVEDGRMNTEREFLDGLQKANRYELKGRKLFLYAGKKLLLTFSGKNK
jgi:heat shock protein HslJ